MPYVNNWKIKGKQKKTKQKLNKEKNQTNNKKKNPKPNTTISFIPQLFR